MIPKINGIQGNIPPVQKAPVEFGAKKQQPSIGDIFPGEKKPLEKPDASGLLADLKFIQNKTSQKDKPKLDIHW